MCSASDQYYSNEMDKWGKKLSVLYHAHFNRKRQKTEVREETVSPVLIFTRKISTISKNFKNGHY